MPGKVACTDHFHRRPLHSPHLEPNFNLGCADAENLPWPVLGHWPRSVLLSQAPQGWVFPSGISFISTWSCNVVCLARQFQSPEGFRSPTWCVPGGESLADAVSPLRTQPWKSRGLTSALHKGLPGFKGRGGERHLSKGKWQVPGRASGKWGCSHLWKTPSATVSNGGPGLWGAV